MAELAADNGPFRGSKGSTYEGGIRVPAVVHWPNGIKDDGQEIHSTTGYIDVYPTLKRIAGLESPDPNPLDGIDLLPIIRKTAKAEKRKWHSYVAQGNPSNKFAFTDGPWKLVLVNGLPDQADSHRRQAISRTFNLSRYCGIKEPRIKLPRTSRRHAGRAP